MWSKSGFLARILRHLQDLQEMLIVQGELEVTPWHVDTTVARANKAAAGAGKKGAREPSDHGLGRSRSICFL
jgi:hypothetical protein